MEECHGHLTSQPSKSFALEHSDFQPSSLDTSRVGSLLPDLDIGSLVRFLGSCCSKAWLVPGGFSPARVVPRFPWQVRGRFCPGQKRVSRPPLRPALPAAHSAKRPAIGHLHPPPSHWTDGSPGPSSCGCQGTGARNLTAQVTRNRLRSHSPSAASQGGAPSRRSSFLSRGVWKEGSVTAKGCRSAPEIASCLAHPSPACPQPALRETGRAAIWIGISGCKHTAVLFCLTGVFHLTARHTGVWGRQELAGWGTGRGRQRFCSAELSPVSGG